MAKKKFKETKVGQWLSQKAPGILGTIGNVFPPAKILSSLIAGAPEISLADQLEFEKLLASTYEAELENHQKNTEGARGLYSTSKEMTNWVARRIMN
ncbi:MAG: hypothetical protein JKY55_01015 [Aliivibrio sp.]|uniref:hypothetical protein n=1 Tax=Aliivibrio sp. TaxID=1872443 RepID=UPI001A499409|nr:hypothetical protein [Aliivibrio sp.]